MAERKRPTVLIADDEDVIRLLLKRRLGKEGYAILTAENGLEAITQLEKCFVSVVITDLKMPGADGMQVLERAKQLDPDTEVLIMTAYASTETAIGAVRAGAFDYLTKPFEHVDEVVHKIRQALEHRRLVLDNRAMMKRLEELNRGLKKVVVERTRELNKVSDDLLALRQLVARERQDGGDVPTRMLDGLERICALAARLEDEEHGTSDAVATEIAGALRKEAESLSDLAAMALAAQTSP